MGLEGAQGLEAALTSGLAYPRHVADDRDELLKQAAFKVLLIALAAAAVVGLGTWGMVKALGLDDTSSDSTIGGSIEPIRPLPSTALPVPSESIPGATDAPSPSPSTPASGELQLNASPLSVGPMERINLTGSYPGQDNLSLSVQRLENGQWTDFGVQASVRVGTFETWVQTGRIGEHQWRMFDPATQQASNPVTVTVQ